MAVMRTEVLASSRISRPTAAQRISSRPTSRHSPRCVASRMRPRRRWIRLEPASGQLGKKALDRVEPGGRGRGEVELKALVPSEPGANLGMLVPGVIVDNQMHVLLSRGLAIDRIEEADEFLVPMAAHALADDLAVEDVEGAAQSCPPPRPDSGRPQSRAVRMDSWTSSGVRQWRTARGMGPTGFAQIAVAAAYPSPPGNETRPGSCASSRRNARSI